MAHTYICAKRYNPGVHEDNGCLGKQAMEVASLVNDEENTTADLKSKGKNIEYTCYLMVNNCQGKVAEVI